MRLINNDLSAIAGLPANGHAGQYIDVETRRPLFVLLLSLASRTFCKWAFDRPLFAARGFLLEDSELVALCLPSRRRFRLMLAPLLCFERPFSACFLRLLGDCEG